MNCFFAVNELPPRFVYNKYVLVDGLAVFVLCCIRPRGGGSSKLEKPRPRRQLRQRTVVDGDDYKVISPTQHTSRHVPDILITMCRVHTGQGKLEWSRKGQGKYFFWKSHGK